MYKINGDKAQMLTDAVHSAGAAAEMPSVVPGEGPCGTPLPAAQGGGGGMPVGRKRRCAAPTVAVDPGKQTLNTVFIFYFFS